MIKLRTKGSIQGYGSTASVLPERPRPDKPDYATRQETTHLRVVQHFLLRFLEHEDSSPVVDVGCGVGGMVMDIVRRGYDAYGIDLPHLVDSWAQNDRPRERFCVVDPLRMELPFDDETVGFAFSFGAIEHVGTTDGHADRRDDYHEIRQKWLREIYRVLRPGGRMLMGGPNRCFPVDIHGPDSRSSRLEKWTHGKLGLTIHRTWGEYFLWSFGDFHRYLAGLDYQLEAVSMKGYFEYTKNTPGIVKPLIKLYVDHLPRPLLGTGFNPWATAMIRKTLPSQVSARPDR